MTLISVSSIPHVLLDTEGEHELEKDTSEFNAVSQSRHLQRVFNFFIRTCRNGQSPKFLITAALIYEYHSLWVYFIFDV